MCDYMLCWEKTWNQLGLLTMSVTEDEWPEKCLTILLVSISTMLTV